MAALTDVDVANQSLAMISSRSQIVNFNENTVEAKNVNIFYNRIRDQVMTMAWWNFARRTEALSLMKSAPGTPENPNPQVPWTSANPAPPWLYQYRYPNDCLLFRYITYKPNSQPSLTTSTPLTTAIMSSDSWWPGPPQKFVVATDFNLSSDINNVHTDPVLSIDVANPALFAVNDLITISDVVGTVEVNANTYLVVNKSIFNLQLGDPNTGISVDGSRFTPYVSGGSASLKSAKVILTNTIQALGCYTARITDPNIWPAEFYNAFATALAGFLAYPISGKLDLKTNLLQEANGMIIEARRTDGNEGITNQDITPDWIRIRGLQYQDWWGTGGAGWDQGAYSSYPPLFSVS
jgi:hypothetical protein